MKSKLGMIAILLLAVMLTTYSTYVSAGSDISQAWKGQRTSRTWTVFEFVGAQPDEFHLRTGDIFRIEEKGHDNIHLIPLKSLRGRWKYAENSSIPLNRKGSERQRLCGNFNLDNHPNAGNSNRPHFILIDAHPEDENIIRITISDDLDFNCDEVTHGGVVHARN